LLAILPHFIIFLIYSRLRLKAWLAFFIGGGSWLGALLLRSPLLQLAIILNFYPEPIESISTDAILAVSMSIWYIAFSSLMAGLFEELIRFLIIKKIKLTSKDSAQLMSFGLGWGLIEAFLLHTLALIPYLTSDIATPLVFIGVVERIIIITFHVAMTFLVYKCVKDSNNIWVLMAILIHFSLDFFGVMVAFHINIILGEIIFATITILTIFYLRVDYMKKPPSFQDVINKKDVSN